MKSFVRILDLLLPLLGVLLIVGALLPDLPSQTVGLIILGALLILFGLFRVSRNLLPDERRFLALRAETDLFISLMRSLNATAVALRKQDTPEGRREFEQIRDAMFRSVERMAEVAGQTVKHIARETGQPDLVAMWKRDFFGSPD